MTADMWLTLAILAIAILLFVTEWLRVDVVALGVVVALMITELLTPAEAISGFSNSAVITIAALFIVGGAVLHTGLAAWIGQRILGIAGTDETRLIVVIMIAVGTLSGFMSSTGTVAVLLPAIIALARTAKISPSKLLIPLAFSSLLGGATTLIGTPPNIIVNDLLLAENLRLGETFYSPFRFFDYTPIGLLLLAAGVVFMVTIGKRLLPDHVQVQDDLRENPAELISHYHLQDNLYYLRLGGQSTLAGQSIANASLRTDFDVTVIEITRRGERPLAQFGEQRIILQSKQPEHIYPSAKTVLQADDMIIVKGEENDVRRMANQYQLILEPPLEDGTVSIVNRQVGIAEVLLPPRSKMVDKRLRETELGSKYNLTVLDIQRPGASEDMNIEETQLAFGDTLIIQGLWQDIHNLKRNRRDLVVIGEPGVMLDALNTQKAPIAALILGGMLVIMVTNALPLATASLLAALFMVLSGCLSMDEAYEAIDWKSIVLIAGMLPMAIALDQVGLVSVVADWTTDTLGDAQPRIILGGLFLLTSILTQVLSNTATTVLVAPIALAIAQQLGLQPYGLLMSVAIAASMAFASPVASPVNTLILGAGNYSFVDFFKVGLPMIFIMLIVSVVTIPIFFPF